MFRRLDKTRQRPIRQSTSYLLIILRTSCINSSCSSPLKRPKNSSSTLSPIGIAAASIFSPSAVSQTKRRRLSAASCSRLTKPRFSILANISASVALVLTAASISATCSIPVYQQWRASPRTVVWSGQVTRAASELYAAEKAVVTDGTLYFVTPCKLRANYLPLS